MFNENAKSTDQVASQVASGSAIENRIKGGEVVTPAVSSSGGMSFVSFGTATWSGVITARGALIYKDGGPAVCVLDFGADRTSTLEFQVQFPPATADSALIRLS